MPILMRIDKKGDIESEFNVVKTWSEAETDAYNLKSDHRLIILMAD